MAMFNPVTQKNSAIPSAQVVDDSGEKKKKNFLQQEEMSGWNRLKEGSHLPWAVGVKQKLQKGTEKKMTGRKITQIMEQKIQRYWTVTVSYKWTSVCNLSLNESNQFQPNPCILAETDIWMV